MKTQPYTVVHRYRCGGVWNEAGDRLELPRAAADGLVAVGSLKPASPSRKTGGTGATDKQQEA